LASSLAQGRGRAAGHSGERRRLRRPGVIGRPASSGRAGDGEPGAARANGRREGAGAVVGRSAGISRAGRVRLMTAPTNAVRVIFGGEEYPVKSELPPEYTREVATYLDTALKRVRDSIPGVETHKAAILAALAITDELFQARRGDREIATRIAA